MYSNIQSSNRFYKVGTTISFFQIQKLSVRELNDLSKVSHTVGLFWNHNSNLGNLISKLTFSTATLYSLFVYSLLHSVSFCQEMYAHHVFEHLPSPSQAKSSSCTVHLLFNNLKIRANVLSGMMTNFQQVLMKLTAIFCKYMNEVYFYSTEITKTDLLFGFNILTMETLEIIVNIMK